MKKLTHLLGALIMLALPMQLMADNYDKYYQNLPCQMTRPTLPVIPGNNVSVTDFGGVGDGKADEECHACRYEPSSYDGYHTRYAEDSALPAPCPVGK